MQSHTGCTDDIFEGTLFNQGCDSLSKLILSNYQAIFTPTEMKTNAPCACRTRIINQRIYFQQQ